MDRPGPCSRRLPRNINSLLCLWKGGDPVSEAAALKLKQSRWWILVVNVVAMVAIANLQYGWTQFTTPLTKSMNTTLTVIQVGFTLFIAAQTWGQPFYG